MVKVPRLLLALASLALPACGLVLGLNDLVPIEGSGEAGSLDGGEGGVPTEGGSADAGPEGGCGDVRSSSAHCGRCGHSCLGGACVDGGCQPVALTSGQGSIGGVALGPDHVYFTSVSGNLVARVGKDGGVVESYAAAPDVKFALRVAVDETNVYWTNSELGSSKVLRCPIVGTCGTPEQLAVPQEAIGLALDATSVYWADRNGGRIARRAKAGGPELLVGNPSNLPMGVAVDGPDVFWITDFPGQVERREADGGTVPLGAAGQSGRVLAADARNVYFGSEQDPGELGNVARVPRGGGPVVVVARAGGEPKGMVLDTERVYWTSWLRTTGGAFVSGGVHACGLAASCGEKTLVIPADEPRGIAVDRDAVYFGTRDGILRVAKP